MTAGSTDGQPSPDGEVTFPDFDDLPEIEALGLRHAWDVFGRSDRLGTLHRLQPANVLAAVRLVRIGDVFSLDLPLTEPDPPLFGRTPFEHTTYGATKNDWDDRLDNFFPQASTQWDALSHVRCREFGFFGGRTEDPEPHGPLGIDAYAEHGIVGRGVLIDVDQYLADIGQPLGLEPAPISASTLRDAAAEQGVEVRPGDILCIRTGWVGRYLQLSRSSREEMAADPQFPGLSAGEEMARQLWDWGLAAVCVDNPAVEVRPGDPSVGFLHRRLIPLLGMALGELFVLDDLAEACQSDDRWEFLFVGVPLKIPGGIGSPANAVAIR